MLNKRRHDVDAIRAIALFLLIAYHLGISFMSWAPFVFFIPNIKSIDSLWIPMAMINTWRIPILFLISGIAFRFSFENRSPLQLIKERLKVLGIPLLFGSFTSGALVVYFATLFWERKGEGEAYFGADSVHLWFLENIIIYSLIFVLMLRYIPLLRNKSAILSKLLSKPGGIFLFSLPIIYEGHLVETGYWREGNDYSLYVDTLHGFFLGAIWFLLGIILTSQGEDFWESNKINWKIHAVFAFSLYIYRFLNEFEGVDNRIIAFESFNFIFLVLGLGATYLNKESSQLNYYKTAIFPVYIVHFPIQYGLMLYFGGWDINPWLKYLIFLFLICFLSLTFYHAIKNVRILRPLFGLRNKPKKEIDG